MKSFLFSLVVILAGAFVSVNATCQGDFAKCKASYGPNLNKTTGHPRALCMLANEYISCLWGLSSRQRCWPLASQITEERRNTEDMLFRNATGCMLCRAEVENCERAYAYSDSVVHNDQTALCKDGQKFVVCLMNVEVKPECVPEKFYLEKARRTAEERLNEGVCDNGRSCLSGIRGCEIQAALAKNMATTLELKCKVMESYYGCLSLQQCTGDYQGTLRTLLEKAVTEATENNCQAVTSEGNCLEDLNTCTATYERGLDHTAGKPGDLCMLANRYISCLRDLADPQNRPDCQPLHPYLSETRRKVEDMLNRNASGCILCTNEVDTCRASFAASDSQAGHNLSAVCRDAQIYFLCLKEVDRMPECQAERSLLEDSRARTEEILHKGECGPELSCLGGVQACQTKEVSALMTATTNAQKCQVMETFYKCLLTQHCPAQYERSMKRVLDATIDVARKRHCSFTNPGNSADGMTSSKAVVMFLAVAVAAFLKY